MGRFRGIGLPYIRNTVLADLIADAALGWLPGSICCLAVAAATTLLIVLWQDTSRDCTSQGASTFRIFGVLVDLFEYLLWLVVLLGNCAMQGLLNRSP